MRKFIEILIFGGMIFLIGYSRGQADMTKEANKKICQAMNEKGNICSQ